MTVKFYFDEHVHRAITTGLRLRQVDVLTAQEDHHRNTPDADLIERATALNRVIFSQDEDMLVEAQKRQTQGLHFSGVIYAHQLRITIGLCVRELELIPKVANPEDLANQAEYLPL